ncbi:response regulator [bacterium]|nr:response regulator [bacterium]
MAEQQRILIVEDEENLADGLRFNLEAEGYRCEVVGDGNRAIERILTDPPDLVLLDVMLPGASGFEVCDRVRERGVLVPILFLTARDTEDDRIQGLALGGDDYMTKPFSLRELIGRVKAVLRREQWYRSAPPVGDVITFGTNRVDFNAFKAWTEQGELDLTQKECMVLRVLVEHEGKVVDRDTLLDQVWSSEHQYTRTIDNIILRLRKYFESNPRKPKHIQSVYGAGYRFVR